MFICTKIQGIKVHIMTFKYIKAISMNQIRSLTISHLGPLLINHLGNNPHQYLIAQCVWYGAYNIML